MKNAVRKTISLLLCVVMMVSMLPMWASAASSEIGKVVPTIGEREVFELLSRADGSTQSSDSGNNNRDGLLCYYAVQESEDSVVIDGSTIQWSLSYASVTKNLSCILPYYNTGWVITGMSNFSCKVEGTDALSIVSYPTSSGALGTGQIPDHKIVLTFDMNKLSAFTKVVLSCDISFRVNFTNGLSPNYYSDSGHYETAFGMEPASYKVYYDANGGMVDVTEKETINFNPIGELPIPSREGYTFLYWSNSPEGDSRISETSMVQLTHDVTLYAQWGAISPVTYQIDYHANGGENAPAAQSKTHDVTLILSDKRPTRSGYSFLGWAESSTATTAQYQSGGSFTKDADTILYAVWKAKTYTVTYDYATNGGISASKTTDTVAYSQSADLSVTAYRGDAYAFLGWNTDPNAAEGLSEYTVTGDVTLYAIFEPSIITRTYYNITWTLDKVTGTLTIEGVGNMPKVDSCPEEPPVERPVDLPIDLRMGLLAVSEQGENDPVGREWLLFKEFIRKVIVLPGITSISSNAFSGCCLEEVVLPQTVQRVNSYAFSTYSPLTQDFTLTDVYYGGTRWQWEELLEHVDEGNDLKFATIHYGAAETYTVSFDANGGSGAPAAQSKTHGATLTLSSTKPTRTGYTFLGWAESSTATTAQYQSGGSFTKNADTTLYAVWKANTYTISYNANGGSGAPSAQTKTHSATLTLSSTKPTRTGYTFLGWAESSTATTAQYQSGGSFTKNTNATLYAVWKANTYTISYNANGGSGAPAAQTKTHGATLTLSSTKPTRTGYTFLGWVESSTATTAQYQSGGSFTKNADTTLYAVWNQITYTITVNGGTADKISAAENTTVTVTANTPANGKVFDKWTSSEDVVFANASASTTTFQMPAKNVIITANYKNATYTLSVTAPTFSSASYGYTQPASKALTLKNTGNSDSTITSIALSGTGKDAFTLNKTSGSTIKAGATDSSTYTVRPKAGLDVGSYTATVTVTYNNGATATANVSFTVTTAGTVAAPVFSLTTGSYVGTQSVTITCSTSGATVYYTTDGSTPTTSSTKYSGAISVTKSATIKAIAVKTGYANSAVAEAKYTITAPTYTLSVTAPTFNSVSYGYTQPAAKALTIKSTGNSGATITSVTLSRVGKDAFTLNKTGVTTIKAGATDNSTYTIRPKAELGIGSYTAIVTVTYNNGATATAIVSFTVTTAGTVAAPVFSLAAGSYVGTQSVTITCSTSGATVYYTTDGSTPTTSSTKYSGAISVTKSATIKAIAVKTGYANSAVAEAAYTITTPVTYTVSYNANGGIGTPSAQTKEANVPLTLSSVKPSKTYLLQYNANGGSVSPASKNVACTFKNWNTEQNGRGTSYSSGGSYMNNAQITLYAQWMDPSAGTLAVPSRSGYDFVGWFTSATGRTQITETSTVTGNMTVYAHWTDPYNLGDETYSFGNYVDLDSQGHCFGMSMTSAGYHNNLLDIAKIGGNASTPLYSFSDTSTVRQPICYYQNIQGSYREHATVAGGSWYLHRWFDIESDWREVVNYVNNHAYDGTGLLQIGFKKGRYGHAINFLRYEKVNGQDRIYAYDNNFPNQETYFYQDSSGGVWQAPVQTFSGAIDCIALRDCRKYFDIVVEFDATHVLYMQKDVATIQGYSYSLMEGGFSGEEYVMYEIPASQDRVIIIPNRDYADFIYMDTEYSFGKITEKTRGELRLVSLDDSAASTNVGFRIFELDSTTPTLTITQAGTTLHYIIENCDIDKSLLLVADYDESGRMLRVQRIILSSLQGDISVKNASRHRVFLIDRETNAPLCAAWGSDKG